MGEGLFQPTHLLLIFGIALILLGPGKLSEAGSALGKSVREFRRATTGEIDAPSVPHSHHCTACGRDVGPDSRFCPQCGAALRTGDSD
jgi:sec-independent protein translocase protein TatA